MGSYQKPTIIVVHGAWHRPEHYSNITDRLTAAGYKFAAPHLPSNALDEPVPSFDLDVETIRRLIESSVDQDEDVIVVCHSYGGLPSSEATKGLLKKERADKGLKGGVVSMIYMCAFVADVNQSLVDIAESGVDQDILENGKSLPKDPTAAFYNDVDPAILPDTIKKLRPQSPAVVHSKVSFAPWKHVPSTYILCEKDQAIKIDAQENFTHPSRGGLWTLRRLNAGHSPFLNVPDQVFGIIEETVSIARASA